MNIKTFPTKLNTILYNSDINMGKNPICELFYGYGYSRVLVYFDISRISSLMSDKTFTDTTKIKHILRFKNCWGIQSFTNTKTTKERTSSFDLELIRLPETFDGGNGSDIRIPEFSTYNSVISTNGSNWYNASTNNPWINGNGAITNKTVLATQHFDIGDEDIEIDITNEVNSIINNINHNYGFMIKFSDELENTQTDIIQYVSFFTQNTTLGILQPYIETTYDNQINDNRNDFYLDKYNRLYFYSIIGGKLTNLDILPSCTIDDIPYEVKQSTKGVYYVEIKLDSMYYEPNVMLYDTWSNITYNGKNFPEVELDFVTKQNLDYFNFNNSKTQTKRYIPNVYGINKGQKLNYNSDIIKIGVQTREEYMTNKNVNTSHVQYRIYCKINDKEINFIDYEDVNKTHSDMYFMLDIPSLPINKYFIDLKVNIGDEVITHKNILHFEIVSELN